MIGLHKNFVSAKFHDYEEADISAADNWPHIEENENIMRP